MKLSKYLLLTIMSKLTEQLEDLKSSINNIKEQMKKMKVENILLSQQQNNLVSEKADLVKKNEVAKDQINSILERIKNIEG
jgi:cell division protein ZapB|tara:strand:- start:798 stop:1040 length:243 start_codon:yes stop_codon:yes gene_type:complete